MNITVLIMYLASLGFVLLGAYLLNNKYVKSKNKDEEIENEVKSIKVSGYTNITIGAVGILCATIALLNGSLMNSIIIIFVISITVLTLIQYIFNKKVK